MAAGTLVRRVMLQVTADDMDVAEKLDAIKAKGDELRDQFPELVARINTAEAQAKLRALKDEFAQTAEQTDAEPLEIRVSSAEAQAKLDAIKANAEELRALNPRLVPVIDDAEASAKLALLRGELKATEEEGERDAEGVGKAWEVTKYAFLGVGAGLLYGTYKAAGFNQEMLRVHTLAGVSTTQLGSLSTQVLQLSGQVGQGPDSLAESLYHVASNMASMGATSTQMMGAVKIAAQGAAVGGADLVDVTNALGAAIASGIPGVQNYQSAMGALNATVGAGDMTMQNLAEAMGTGFLSNVKGYGSTLSDVGAILATFGDNNIRGAHAGTQLRMSVQALAVQAATAKPYLQQMGMAMTGPGSIGDYQKIHGTVATIDMLNAKFKEMGIGANDYGNIVTQLFGKKAGAGIMVLLEQEDRLNSKQKVLAEGAKTFGAEWAQQMKSPQQQLKNLEMGSEALAISLGTKLLPVANRVVGWANSFMQALQHGNGAAVGFAGVVGTVLGLIALKKAEDGLKGAVEGVEGLVKGTGKGYRAVRNLAAGLSDADKAASEASGKWGTAGGNIAKALGGVKSAAEAALKKLGLLKDAEEAAAGEGALPGGQPGLGTLSQETSEAAAAEEAGQGLEEAEGKWGRLGTKASSVLSGIKAMAMSAAEKLGLMTGATEAETVATEGEAVATTEADAAMDANPIGLIILAVAGLVIGIIELVKHWRTVEAVVKEVFHNIENWVGDGVRWIEGHWKLLLGILLGPIAIAAYEIATHWKAITRGASEMYHDVVNFFTSLPRRIVAALGDMGQLLWNAGVSVIKGLIGGISSMIGSLGNAMGGIAGEIKNFLPFSPARKGPLSGAGSPLNSGISIGRMLAEGMTSEFTHVSQASHRLTSAVSLTASGASGGYYGGRPGYLQVEWVGGGSDQEVITYLKKHIRIRGGDPSVLGR